MSFQVSLRFVLLKPWVVYGFEIQAMIQRGIQVFLRFFFGNALIYPLLAFAISCRDFAYYCIFINNYNFIIQVFINFIAQKFHAFKMNNISIITFFHFNFFCSFIIL